MAATSATQTAKTEAGALQEQARRHLWMHFTRMGSFGPEHEVPIIVHGEGCYVWDDHGNRYLDGLSALFCVNSGHGRAELGDAMAAAGPRARLHHRLELRPSPGDRARHPDRLAGARRPEPGLLHQQRLRGGGVGLEADAQLSPGSGATARRPSSSPARSPTTALPSAPSVPPASRSSAATSSRWPPAAFTFRTRTATDGPPTAIRSGRRMRSSSGSCSRGRRRSPP